MIRLSLLAALVVAACSNSTPTKTNCSTCQTSCQSGLLTIGLVLDPPGCGTQCSTQFCPGGCSADGQSCLGFSLADGGMGSCVASSLTATQGVFQSGGVAVSLGDTILLATSSTLACRLFTDAGAAAGSNAAGLFIDWPPGLGGMASVPQVAATLVSASSDGVLTRTPATSGSVTVNVGQPGGGFIGSYDLQFGSDAEQGSFTAPDCDVCLTPPP